MCVSLSVPGVSTARPSASADQPSRRSTACRGTRRGRPRRRWRARRPSRAAHRCPVYGLRERPTWLLPSSCGGSVTKTRGAEPVRRVAVARIRTTSRRHNGDASHIHGRHGHARALTFEASGELPALVGCCASTTAQTRWRRVEVVEVRKRQSRTSRQAWLAAAVEACAFCRRLPPPGARGASSLAAQVCRGCEGADYSSSTLQSGGC